MRSAPFGLIPSLTAEQAFDLAVAGAVHTHGHPTGYLAAGAFAAIVHRLNAGVRLAPAVQEALDLLADRPHHEETALALQDAMERAESRQPSTEHVVRLGQGWVAEEALAIAVYCAALHDDVRLALRRAVNHGGDSDSTGAICGNLLGVMHGRRAFPQDWVARMEGRDDIERIANDFATEFGDHPDRSHEFDWFDRYPPT